MRQYVVIAPIESISVGDIYAVESFPLHVTLVPPFVVRNDDQIAGVIAGAAAATSSFAIVGESTSWFGVNRDIPVTLVSPEPSHTIHTMLIRKLATLGWTPLQDSYSGNGFVAHVSQTENSEFEVDARVTVEEFALVELSEAATVLSRYSLRSTR